MHIKTKLPNFLGCWTFWFALFAVERMGTLQYLPDIVLFLLGFILFFGAAVTAISGHDLAKHLISNATAASSKFGWLLCGVFVPLILLGILCLVFSDSSLLEIFAYIAGNPWNNYTTLEYVLICNLFVAISFLFLDKTSSTLSWANGNLFFFFVLSFWPQNDGPSGYLCGGQFFSLDEFSGNCNGVALQYTDIMSFKEYLEIQWGLDTIASNLASFVQYCAPALLGLFVLGVVHVLWRKPSSLC